MQITLTRKPERPFFIISGAAETSRAPASIMRCIVYDRTSPVTSSTLVSRISTKFSSRLSDSRIMARSTFAQRGRSFVPAP